MSATFYPAALQIKPPDPFGEMQKYASVLKTQADTGLTKAQTVTEGHRPDLIDSEAELNRANVGLVGANTTKAQIQNWLDYVRYQYGMQRAGAWSTDSTGQGQGSSYRTQSGFETGTQAPAGATGGSMLNQPPPGQQTQNQTQPTPPVSETSQGQGGGSSGTRPAIDVSGGGAQPASTTPLASLTPAEQAALAIQQGRRGSPATQVAANLQQPSQQQPGILGRYPGSYQTADASGTTPPPTGAGGSETPALDNALSRLRAQHPDITALGPGGVASGPAMNERMPTMREQPIPPEDMRAAASGATPAQAPFPGGAPQIPNVQPPPGWGNGQVPLLPGQNTGQSMVSRPPEMGLAPGSYYVTGVGPVPGAWIQQAQAEAMMDMLSGKGGSEASMLDKLKERRDKAIINLISTATDSAAWDRNVELGYQQGLLTGQDRVQFEGHFDNKQKILDAYTTPQEQRSREASANERGLTYQTPTGGAAPYGPGLAVQNPVEVERTVNGVTTKSIVPKDVWVRGNQWAEGQPVPVGMTPVMGPMQDNKGQSYMGYRLVPTSAVVQPGGQGGGQQGQQQGGNDPYSQYRAKTAGAEGGDAGTPNQAGSSARGTYSWMPQTWRENARKFAPEATAGMTDAQVDGLLSQQNPNRRALEDQVFAGFTRDNAAALQQNGVQPSAAALHLAHWFGAEGAGNIAKAPATTLVRNLPGISQETMRMNGIPPNATVGDLVNFEIKRFGLARVQVPGGSSGLPLNAPETPAGLRSGGGGQQQPAPAPAPAQGTPQPPAEYPNAPTSVTGYTKGKESQIAVDDKLVEQDAPTATEANTAAVRVNSTMPQVYDALNRLHNAATGWGSNTRVGMSNFFAQMNTPWASAIAKFITNNNIDPSKAADMKILQKELFTQVVGAEQATGGRVGAMFTKMFSNAMPNTDMPEVAIRAMLHNMLVMGQMAKDYGGGMNAYYNKSRDAYQGDMDRNTRYQPITKFDQDWTQNPVHQPIVYEAATRILNGDQWAAWGKGLNDDQRDEAARIALAALPGFHPGSNQRRPGSQ